MKIKRCPIVFNNVLSLKAKCNKDQWHIALKKLNQLKNESVTGTPRILSKKMAESL
jgi:hypothetical protein